MPSEVASILGVKMDTLRIWRTRGTGPSVCRVGRLCRYRAKDVEQYIEGVHEESSGECAGTKLRRVV